jgi:hypothetical protein
VLWPLSLSPVQDPFKWLTDGFPKEKEDKQDKEGATDGTNQERQEAAVTLNQSHTKIVFDHWTKNQR